MSYIDPARSAGELGLVHPSLDAYLDAIVADLLASWITTPPEGFAQRAAELRLA